MHLHVFALDIFFLKDSRITIVYKMAAGGNVHTLTFVVMKRCMWCYWQTEVQYTNHRARSLRPEEQQEYAHLQIVIFLWFILRDF